MRKSLGFGLLILLMVLFISPVAACPYPTIHKECPTTSVCTNCPMTCTLDVTFPAGHGTWDAYVKDDLPDGSTGISWTGSATETGGIISWNPFHVTNAGGSTHLEVTFTPPAGESTNSAEVKAYWSGGWYQDKTHGTSSSTFVAVPCVPEFPTLALPVAMLLGFVFIVYALKSKK
jgi:hypothetical protein